MFSWCILLVIELLDSFLKFLSLVVDDFLVFLKLVEFVFDFMSVEDMFVCLCLFGFVFRSFGLFELNCIVFFSLFLYMNFL